MLKDSRMIACILMASLALPNLLASCPGSHSSCGDGCIMAFDASSVCVAEAIAAAERGDTVQVTGDAVWTEGIRIEQGIHLRGNDSRIIMMIGDEATGISVQPKADTAADTYDISGFDFDGHGTQTLAISLGSAGRNGWPTAKIHGNVFRNFTTRVLIVSGPWKGVVYDNTWKDNTQHAFRYFGGNSDQWNWIRRYEFGTWNTIFFEDNRFLDLVAVASSGGQSSRVVLRFNNYTMRSNLWPMVDVHGNQVSGVCAMMGWEMYGNDIKGNGYTARYDLRGGRGMLFMNNMTDGGFAPRVRNEFCVDQEGTCKREADTQTFVVQDSYHFLNRDDGMAVATAYSPSGCDEELKEDREFWNENTQFKPGTDSSIGYGVGVGTRQQMDSTECAAGVGFWVTDEGEWNSRNNGPDGRLYRCGPEGAWELFYMPYPYPHPLRGVCDSCEEGHECIGGSCLPRDCSSSLLDAIGQWKSGKATLAQLMEAIRKWKTGC